MKYWMALDFRIINKCVKFKAHCKIPSTVDTSSTLTALDQITNGSIASETAKTLHKLIVIASKCLNQN